MDLIRLGEVVQYDHVLVEPLPIGLTGGEILLELRVLNYLSTLCVQHEHAPGIDALLVQNTFGRNVQHPGLGTHHKDVVRGNQVAARSQAVPVEYRADFRAVRADYQRRAVPRLHHRGVVLVEVLLSPIHRDVVAPGLRY